MVGGKRMNAGRKNVPLNEKKVGHKIYLTPKLEQEVIVYCQKKNKPFSEICASLIQNQLQYEKSKEDKTIRIVDLFAGLGGMRIAAQEGAKKMGYNADCIFTSEIKKHAIKAYQEYFKDSSIHGDITKVSTKDMPDHDILLAGFPCQPFSSAGNGLGFEDTRGTLFFEIERILKEKKPYGFILENVEGLVSHDNGKTLKVILTHLRDLEYQVSYNVLDSKDFGLAQSRKRIYIVGVLKGSISLMNFEKYESKFMDIQEENLPVVNNHFTECLLRYSNLRDLAGKAIKDKRGGENNIHSWDIGLKGNVTSEQKKLLNMLLKERRKKKWADIIGIDWMDGMPLTLEQIRSFYNKKKLENMLDDLVVKGYLKYEYPKKIVNKRRVYDTTKPRGYNIVSGKLSFEFSKLLDPQDIVPTLVATDISRLGVIDNEGVRRLSIRECQRLFGFPEDYSLNGLTESESFDLLGNTVCIPVLEAIFKRVMGNLSIYKDDYK